MKTIPSTLESHLNGERLTLATCWRVTRRDGSVYRFTSHDEDLEVGGETFLASSGYTGTQIVSTDSMSVDNLEVAGLLDNAAITESDLLDGLFDGARVELFLVNWASPGDGTVPLRTGWLGEVKVRDGAFVAELRGLSQALQTVVGEVYSVACRADLGDARCGVDLSGVGPWRKTGSVASVISDRAFVDTSRSEAAGFYDQGVIYWTGGANAGLEMEIKSQPGTTIILAEPMPHAIAAGDTYEITPGCDKSISMCRDRFSNVLNFRGEPYIPGNDRIVSGA